jgi:hypothetical protein
MEAIVFNRSLYYSQTECLGISKLSVKRFNELMDIMSIKPYERPVQCGTPDAGTFEVKAKYYLKADVDRLKM